MKSQTVGANFGIDSDLLADGNLTAFERYSAHLARFGWVGSCTIAAAVVLAN